VLGDALSAKNLGEACVLTKIYIFHRKQLLFLLGIVLLAVAAWLYLEREQIRSVTGPMNGERVFHLVTGEFEAKLPDGTEIEAYRWDPGTIVVNKGEKVKLVIRGISGLSHPFIIEGLNVKGEVKQGKETVVTFRAETEGIYRIICLTHPDSDHNGPMIGYIVVD
jgi:plastocyanin